MVLLIGATQDMSSKLDSEQRMVIVKTLTIFLIIAHEYTLFYDYRMEEFNRNMVELAEDNNTGQPSYLLTTDPVADPLPFNEKGMTALAVFGFVLVVIFLVLSMLAILSICGESYSLTAAIAILWTLLFCADITVHMLSNPYVTRYHYFPSVGLIFCLLYSAFLIHESQTYVVVQRLRH
ncbi:hypothetical protein HDE_08428 [Halotydeus destructor]|nr:hypothetical protein HDE_08428 [Halotydeus destructor]